MLMFKSCALILFTTCLISFNWAVFGLFTRPNGIPNGLRIVYVLGTLLTVVQVSLILLIQEINLIIGLTGLSLYISSLFLFWWAVKTTKDKPLSVCYSDDLPNHIFTTGPYKIIRNPFYTSYLLCGLAGVFVTNQLWLLIIFVVIFVSFYQVARKEEAKFLASNFAAEYKVYRESTGMFLPNLLQFFTPMVPK